MANLADDWINLRTYEKDMMMKALSWYHRAYGKQEVHIALIPFLDRKVVGTAVQKYMDTFALLSLDKDKEYQRWLTLANYLKFGPYVRRWK